MRKFAKRNKNKLACESKVNQIVNLQISSHNYFGTDSEPEYDEDEFANVDEEVLLPSMSNKERKEIEKDNSLTNLYIKYKSGDFKDINYLSSGVSVSLNATPAKTQKYSAPNTNNVNLSVSPLFFVLSNILSCK